MIEAPAKFTPLPEVGGALSTTGERRFAYLPGLDGLRAFAVLAVLLYHAELPWIGGGYLGVEVFFVLSGYLITRLLLAEWRQTGGVNLVAFWVRRARRLLPALFFLLLVTTLFAVLFLPDEVARLRGDVLAAGGYVTNWYLVFNEQSYFEFVGRPSLLQHLWSLAVEEQFYLLWPLLFVGGMRLLCGPRGMLMATLAGAVASTVLMAALYHPDVDPSRIYYGTDTRAAALLIGSALAFAWRAAPATGLARRGWVGRVGGVLPDLAGFGALGVLAWLFVALDETQPFLYQGGFVVVGLATALAVGSVAHPRARLMPRLLGWPPLRWLGLRSYGIYLWHWPIFAVTRPQFDVAWEGAPLLALRLVLTVGLAEVSYRAVEVPVRAGALQHGWRALGGARSPHRGRRRALFGAALVASVVLLVPLTVALVSAKPPALPDYLSFEEIGTTAISTEPVDIQDDPETPGFSVKLAAIQPQPIETATVPAATATTLPTVTRAPEPTSEMVVELPATPIEVVVVQPLPDTPTTIPPPTPEPARPTALPATFVPTAIPEATEPLPTIVPYTVIAPSVTPSIDIPVPPLATPTGPPQPTLPPVIAAAIEPLVSPETPTASPSPGQPMAVEPAQPAPSTEPIVGAQAGPTTAPQQAPTVSVAPDVTSTVPLGRVTAFGDSVMLGAAREIRRANARIEVDAAVSRQASVGIKVLRARRDAGTLGEVVIVHLGSNGYFTARQFDDMMGVLGGARKVIFVNVKVARRWEGPNNTVIAAGVQRYGNAALVDWRAASINHQEYFAKDGIHLQAVGARAYAELIASSLTGSKAATVSP